MLFPGTGCHGGQREKAGWDQKDTRADMHAHYKGLPRGDRQSKLSRGKGKDKRATQEAGSVARGSPSGHSIAVVSDLLGLGRGILLACPLPLPCRRGNEKGGYFQGAGEGTGRFCWPLVTGEASC